MTEDLGPKRVSDKELRLNIDDYFVPFWQNQPTPMGVVGTEDIFVAVFSSPKKLRAACKLFGLPYDSIKQITDGRDFIESVKPHRRIAIDPHKHTNGRVRFREVFGLVGRGQA